MRRIDFYKNSKIVNFIIIAFTLVILASCGGGGGGGSSSLSGGSSVVKITVGGDGQTANLKIEKNTLLAQAKRFLQDLIKTDTALAAIPAEVFKIVFTISAPDMATIAKDVLVSGQTSITETFTVPNGSNRYFLVEAKNATATVLYRGNTYADLNGGTVTLNIIMMPKTGIITLTATSMITEADGQTITYTATVDHAPQGSDLVLTLSNGAIITIPAGQTTGSAVGISSGDEDVYVDPSTITTSITNATGGNYTSLDISGTATSVVTDTINTTTLNLTAPATVVEGGQITYTANLSNPAQDPVTVTLSNGATITIAGGMTSGSVTVLAPGAGSFSVSIAGVTGGNFESLFFDSAAVTTIVTSPSVQLSALTASPTTLAAGQSSIIAAAVTDIAGNPVNGQTVTFNLQINSSGAILVPTTAVTDTQGIATATYTSGAASPATSVDDIVQASLPNGSTRSVSITRSGAQPPPAGMVLIPAGSFQMGDAVDGTSSEMPVHTVTVSAFYLDKYEVTKALWDEVYAWATAHGYTFDNVGVGTAATHPVQTVSWYDVIKWLNARSEREGRTSVYYTDSGQATVYRTGQVDVAAGAVKWTANGYRLPTEAEWEYTARGGTTTRYYTGNCISSDTQANYNGTTAYYGCPTGQSRGATTVVGSFPANPWGLYDMAGNVFEWTWDWYGAYSSSTVTNPQGPASGSYRVVRGSGSWDFGANSMRSADRTYGTPSNRFNDLGFRSALGQP